jgi:NodT family efflux transporter outer membrane factor (OMF) lipoprotein
MNPSLRAAPLLLSLLLAGCGLLPKVGPDYQPAPPPAPAAWLTPLPHGGDTTRLTDWWRQWDDPLLAELIAAVETDSVSLAQAWARIQQARAEQVAAGAAVKPSLDASLNLSRADITMGGPAISQTSRSASLLSAWEIDLFGGLSRRQEAATASFEASRTRWHEARVSLAAETAQAFVQTRFLERRLQIAEADLNSRRESARLTRQLQAAGFQPEEAAALAEAGAAEAAANLVSLQADYDQQIKALVALSGWAEAELRAKLGARRGQFARPAQFQVTELPAALLGQRPDLAAAERDVAAASAAIGESESYRYPKLQLTGSLTPMRQTNDGNTVSLNTWSIAAGLVMPLVDGGRIDANVDAARAQYQAAARQYRQKAREAVREVEQALLRLEAARQREADVRLAAAGYAKALAATRVRHQAGLAGPLELQEASRLALAAETSVAAWQREQLAAWVDLYRAVGGGWEHGADVPAPQPLVTNNSIAGSRS